jgi:hypothetical protein
LGDVAEGGTQWPVVGHRGCVEGLIKAGVRRWKIVPGKRRFCQS